MALKNRVEAEIERLTDIIINEQHADGTWRYCFESGLLTDSFMIILLATLETEHTEFEQQLAERIAHLQQANGAWKLYTDEPGGGNVSATIQGYYALLITGHSDAREPHMRKAERFIIEHGGLEEADVLTRTMLAVNGHLPWDAHLPLPVEVLLLPTASPFSFQDFVGYARVHIAPVLILAETRFTITGARIPDLSHLLLRSAQRPETRVDKIHRADRQKRSLSKLFTSWLQPFFQAAQEVKQAALRKAETFMLKRIEVDGTLYSYASATFLMIFALLALGYKRDDQVITRALKALFTLTCTTPKGKHVESSTATVWDTALLCHALQQSVPLKAERSIDKGLRYILRRQHKRYGDWAVRNPDTPPGGWGFSHNNTSIPDIDDTSAALRAISDKLSAQTATYPLQQPSQQSTIRPSLQQTIHPVQHAAHHPVSDSISLSPDSVPLSGPTSSHNGDDLDDYISSWNRGLRWLFSMQNDDGGWPAFEKNTDNRLLTLLPIEQAEDWLIDPSTADLTGRTLECLGRHAGLTTKDKRITKAVKWLFNNQEQDGSWYGRWGICYIYGTWAALTGMMAVGVPPQTREVQKAVHWLKSIQRGDGGWGESCRSDELKMYVPLPKSTPSQTAWAVDALVAVHDQPTDCINRGVLRLNNRWPEQDWALTYPTGAGLAGIFYVHYHSYRYIWPLLALSHYRQKFDT